MNETLQKIKTLLVQIEKTDEILNQFINSTDETDIVIGRQYLRKKRSLIKDLLATLVQSHIDVRYYENLTGNALNFLKTWDDQLSIPVDFAESLQKAGRRLA